jgi:hypothetical protein
VLGSLGGLVGGLAGDSLKKGMRGVVGGIAGDAFDQGIGGVVGGLAGELIDEPRNVLGGVVGAAVGNDFMPGGLGRGVSFLNGFMDDIGITEQNQEVMGSKEQVFPRYANPEDGTLNNEEMARVDPTDKLLLDSLRRGEIGPVTDPRIRKAIVDLERKIYNDGRASSFGGGLFDGALMAADPSFKTPVPQNMVGDATERLFPGYKDRRDSLRRQLGLARIGFV